MIIYREYFYNHKYIVGIAALPVILLISGIIFVLIITGSFLAFSFTSGVFGQLLTSEAALGARAGAEDAVRRVVANNYTVGTYNFINTTEGRTITAIVTIERDPIDFPACAVFWGCRYRIISTGKSLFREKRIEVILAVDSNTREIRQESFRILELQ